MFSPTKAGKKKILMGNYSPLVGERPPYSNIPEVSLLSSVTSLANISLWDILIMSDGARIINHSMIYIHLLIA